MVRPSHELETRLVMYVRTTYSALVQRRNGVLLYRSTIFKPTPSPARQHRTHIEAEVRVSWRVESTNCALSVLASVPTGSWAGQLSRHAGMLEGAWVALRWSKELPGALLCWRRHSTPQPLRPGLETPTAALASRHKRFLDCNPPRTPSAGSVPARMGQRNTGG